MACIELVSLLRSNNIKKRELATALGITGSGVAHKLLGRRPWTQPEVAAVIAFLSDRLGRQVTYEELWPLDGATQDDSAGDRTTQVGARDGGPLEDGPVVAGVVDGPRVTNASRTAPTGSAVPVAQDDSAADRPTSGAPVAEMEGEQLTNQASPVCASTSRCPSAALDDVGTTTDDETSSALRDGELGAVSPEACPHRSGHDGGSTGPQGHTQGQGPFGVAHTSGGLAPDTSDDPSAVDQPSAPEIGAHTSGGLAPDTSHDPDQPAADNVMCQGSSVSAEKRTPKLEQVNHGQPQAGSEQWRQPGETGTSDPSAVDVPVAPLTEG